MIKTPAPVLLTFTLAAMALLLTGCEKVIPLDPAQSDAQLVLNAVPSAGKQLSVYFANTRYFLDNSNNQPVPNVSMTIHVNGHDYTVADSIVNCSYYFPYTLQSDDSLAITIDANGHPVTARTYVPRMPQVGNLNAFVDTSGSTGSAMGLGAFRLLAINFELADYPNHEDYYCITLEQRDSGTRYYPYFDRYDTVDTSFLTYFLCLDAKLTSPDVSAISGMGDVFFNRLLFSDKNIEGETHKTGLMLLLLTDTTEIAPFVHQYTLHVESVTPERKEYLAAVATATSRMQIFSEPADIYTNVTGALGIFAGNARRTYRLTPDTLVAQ